MENKEIIMSFTISICIIIMLYLSASFSFWDFNPKNWSEASRVIISMFMVIGVFISTIISNEISNKH